MMLIKNTPPAIANGPCMRLKSESVGFACDTDSVILKTYFSYSKYSYIRFFDHI